MKLIEYFTTGYIHILPCSQSTSAVTGWSVGGEVDIIITKPHNVDCLTKALECDLCSSSNSNKCSHILLDS